MKCAPGPSGAYGKLQSITWVIAGVLPQAVPAFTAATGASGEHSEDDSSADSA